MFSISKWNDEYINNVHTLYKKILEEEAKVRLYLKKHNIDKHLDSRIPFEHINLSFMYTKLIEFIIETEKNYSYITKTLSRYSKDEFFLKKVYKIYLAGVCEMIKKNYYSGTIKTYTRETGIETYNNYYKILRNAFKSEGILPSDWEDRKYTHRYQDVLIQESGIPADLVNNIIKFFKIYWKYFKGKSQDSKEIFLKTLEKSKISNYKYEYNDNDLLYMKQLFNEIKEYPTKFRKVLYQLEEIYYYIEDNEYVLQQKSDIDEFCNKASSNLGYDILTVIPNRLMLKTLYVNMLNKVTIFKLKKILSNKPQGAKIKLPNGKTITVGQYKNIIFGKHNLLYVDYTVVPDTSFDLEDIIKFSKNRVHRLENDKILYIANKQFDVSIGQDIIKATKLVYNSQKYYIWFGSIPKGIPIYIDNIKITPEDDIDWNIIINYMWDSDNNYYLLNAYIPTLRIYSEEYRSKKVRIICNSSNKFEHILFINNNGYLGVESINFPLDDLGSDIVSISIQIDSIGEIDNKKIKLENVYLFDRFTKRVLKPETKSLSTGNFLLFIKTEQSILKKETCFLEFTEYIFYNYKVYRFRIYENSNVLELADCKWYFKEIMELYLQKIYSDDNNYDAHDYNQNIINDIDDIRLKVVTNVDTDLLDNASIIIEKDDRIKEFSISNITKNVNNELLIDPEKVKDNFSLLETFVGKWVISLFYRSEKHHEVTFNLVPKISITPIKEVVREDDLVSVTIKSNIACFYSDNGQEIISEKVINMGKAKITISDEAVKGEFLEKNVSLAGLGIEKKLRIEPTVWAVRVYDMQKNLYLKTKRLDIHSVDDFKKYKLVFIGQKNDLIQLNINDVKENLLVNEDIIWINLKKYSQILKQENKVKFFRDQEEININLVWITKIKFIEVIKYNNIIKAFYSYEGPCEFVFYVKVSTEKDGEIYSTTVKTNCIKEKLCVDFDIFSITEDYAYLNVVNEEYEPYLEQIPIKLEKHRNCSLKDIISNKQHMMNEFKSIESNKNYDEKKLKQEVNNVFRAAIRFAEKQLLLGDKL